VQVEHAFSSNHSIYPLTFLQMYQAAKKRSQSPQGIERVSQNRLGFLPGAKGQAAGAIMSAYFHLTTSAYGFFLEDQLAGWMYLRGWQQMFYIESLVVFPEFYDQGIEHALLSFGENTARELHRGWLALTVPTADESAMQRYEMQGYSKGHWRVLRSEQSVPESANGNISLKRTTGSAAKRAYRQFAEQDLQASDPDTALVQSRFLLHDPYYSRIGQHWLIETEGRKVGFLHTHGPGNHPRMVLTTLPESWGSPHMLSIVKKALGATTPEILDIRLGSGRHHDAARAVLEPFGFEEHPADTIRMFKRIDRE
jgi:GNAT superfamily N-acetyltransferase